MGKEPKAKRVVVAMSGGVDSSVAALLLVKAGYEVIGLSMRLFSYEEDTTHGCCTPEDLYDAKRVSDQLGIPHYVSNYEKDFEDHVIDDFVKSYQIGETPNPCVKCNQDVKFTTLRKRALELGAEFLATGHYARRIRQGDKFYLYRSVDQRRDQSYFLFGMNQEELRFTLFPLGELQKEEVRQLAKDAKLCVADKPDSQEICFVSGSYASFVQSRLTEDDLTSGKIVNEAGEVLGRHNGIHQFTVGQRKGLGIQSLKPHYVVSVNRDGTVVVGDKDALLEKAFEIRDTRWVNGVPNASEPVSVQIRSRFKPQPARIRSVDDSRISLTFHEPQSAITPGQAAVIYQEDRCLGGGWIARA